MTRAKRPILSLIISLIGFVGLGVIVWLVPPKAWWIEVPTIILLAISLFLSTSWLLRSWKRSGLLTVLIIGFLLMRRLGILDWLTTGLWLLVLGLISLII